MTTALIPRNETDTFPLSFLDSAGNPVAIPAGVEVVSSDTAIATASLVPGVPDKIVVTPVANGSAVVTVTSGTISAVLDVTIVDPPLASIVIGPGTLSPIVTAPVAGQ